MITQARKADLNAIPKPARSWKRRLIKLVGATLFGLILAEIALRVVEPPPPYVPDEVLGVRASPAPDRDARAFRNSRVPERADIVVLGDSQTEGFGTATREEAWPQVLGSLGGLTVYNMGICGYGAVQHAQLMDQALEFRPKLVLVGFYLGNDLLDAFSMTYELEHWKGLRNPSLSAEEAKAESLAMGEQTREVAASLMSGSESDSFGFKIHQMRIWAQSNVRVYATLGRLTRGVRHQLLEAATGKTSGRGEVEDLGNMSPEVGFVYDGPAPHTVLSPSYREQAVDLSRPLAKEGWRISRGLFLEMRDRAAAQGVKLVLVVIPTKEMVYLQFMERSGVPIPAVFVDYKAHEDALSAATAAFCADSAIPCVVTLPALARALEQDKDIYPRTMNGHPSPEGYRVIANEVHEFLARQDLLTAR